MNSGLFAPNSGSAGCTSASPFEASGLVGFGVSPSGLLGSVGGVVSFTPPLNSGLLGWVGALSSFTPPVYSGTSLTAAST